jgi:hypothetical protein
MANIPEDALRSDDGHYWWDGEQWQLIENGTGTDTTAATDTSDSERVAARVAAGYPASAEHLTDDQKKTLLGEPAVAVAAMSHDEVDVPTMDGHEDGEVTA